MSYHPLYTVPGLRRRTLQFLIALGLDGALFAAALAPLFLEMRLSEDLTSICNGVLWVTAVVAFVLTLFLSMTLIALGLLAWAHRGRRDAP